MVNQTRNNSGEKKIKRRYTKQNKYAQNLTITDLHEHFNNLYSSNKNDIQLNNTNDKTVATVASDDDYNDIDIYDEDLDQNITITELGEAIFSQKNNKSCGLDNISAEIYKYSSNETSPLILNSAYLIVCYLSESTLNISEKASF